MPHPEPLGKGSSSGQLLGGETGADSGGGPHAVGAQGPHGSREQEGAVGTAGEGHQDAAQLLEPDVQGRQPLLQDVLVIAVGSVALTPTSGDAAATDTQSGVVPVTVALPPSDSTRLVHAIQTGKLYFGLRGAGVDLSQSGSVSDSSLFK